MTARRIDNLSGFENRYWVLVNLKSLYNWYDKHLLRRGNEKDYLLHSQPGTTADQG